MVGCGCEEDVTSPAARDGRGYGYASRETMQEAEFFWTQRGG
jgi:hypothetical protein